MIAKILRKVSFFRHLRNPELRRILSIASTKKYKAGEIIFSKEQTGNHLFAVKAGSVKIYTAPGFGRKKTFAYLNKGDFFGEMALLGGKVRSASAQAITSCELLVIPRKKFRKIISTDIEFTLGMLHTLSERLRRANREIESLLFQNILGRLVRTLVDLCGAKRQCPITLELSQRELADFVGTTREPLARALAMLRRGELITSGNRRIIVKNLSRLKTITGVR